jgi:hypothetical protein
MPAFFANALKHLDCFFEVANVENGEIQFDVSVMAGTVYETQVAGYTVTSVFVCALLVNC